MFLANIWQTWPNIWPFKHIIIRLKWLRKTTEHLRIVKEPLPRLKPGTSWIHNRAISMAANLPSLSSLLMPTLWLQGNNLNVWTFRYTFSFEQSVQTLALVNYNLGYNKTIVACGPYDFERGIIYIWPGNIDTRQHTSEQHPTNHVSKPRAVSFHLKHTNLPSSSSTHQHWTLSLDLSIEKKRVHL